MAEQTVSIKVVADKIQRHPLMADLALESIMDYAVDFLRVVGCPKLFEEKVEIIDVEDYRAALPCDWISTIQVRQKKHNRFMPALRYSTDSFHMNQDHLNRHIKKEHSVDRTFKIQGNIIYTSFREGQIEMSYLAIHTDSDGLPMLPDNSKYIRALEYYVRKEYFTILFDMNKISAPVLQNTQQQYAFYVGQAQNDLIKLDISRAESLFNAWSALLPRNHSSVEGFSNDGAKEYLRIKR